MFTELVRNAAENAMAANPGANSEYLGEDGLLHCGICGEPVQQRMEGEIVRKFFPDGIVPSQCRCMREYFRREEEEKKRRKAEERVLELQRSGFADATYLRHTFANDDGHSPKAREAAQWYVEHFSEMKAGGKGLAFIGGTGTGKTFYACCIANALIQRGVTVWVTAMQPLLRKAGDYGAADDLFQRIKTVELLVLDDFGSSHNSARNVDLMFEIIDARARSGLPLIITTNLCASDMENPPLGLGRIYSRIKGMCGTCEKSPVVMDGEDLRAQRARKAHGG